MRAVGIQVRVFSNNEHVRALSGGDVWAIVGWSGDLLPLAARTPAVQVVCPASGTALWADLWAVPSQACHGPQGKGQPDVLPRFERQGGSWRGVPAACNSTLSDEPPLSQLNFP